MNSLDVIQQGAETIIGLEDMEKLIKKGKRMRIKFGVDPTRPDLTFGHMVVFNKLRQFQDLGHQAILLIGDYTATIGDPSSRSTTRPALTNKEVQHNAKTYLDQAFLILDKDKTEIRYNSEWFSKMSFEDSLALSRKMTVARMLERDDFSKRYESNTPIYIIEFLYPLVQGHDSVVLESDVELGGNDQLFNLLVGRALQKDAGQPEQAVICMPLLVGLDGARKMSKSYDNYISFNDSAKNMFGKIMSLSDETMFTYYQMLLNYTDEQTNELKAEHPMKVKKELASSLVAKFHSQEAAAHELQQFEHVFSKGNIPDYMPSFSWSELGVGDEAALTDILNATKLFPSKKEIKRLIEQGAVKVASDKQDDPFFKLTKPVADLVIQAGKRTFLKLN